jgi:hypothetical protein
MSSVRGTIAVDVALTDSTSTSGGSSLNTITLRDATEYTSGKVAIVSGTVGSGVVTIQRTAVGYVNSLGQSVSFSTIERVALRSSSPITLYYRTSFPAIAGLSSSGDRVSVSDVPAALQSQASLGLLLDNTSATASYTLVLYGT